MPVCPVLLCKVSLSWVSLCWASLCLVSLCQCLYASVFMPVSLCQCLYAKCLYAECCYAKFLYSVCCYAECLHSECCYAKCCRILVKIVNVKINLLIFQHGGFIKLFCRCCPAAIGWFGRNFGDIFWTWQDIMKPRAALQGILIFLTILCPFFVILFKFATNTRKLKL